MMNIGNNALMMEEGQYHWTPDEAPAGITVACGVCGSECCERRGVTGPTGWAEAMAVSHRQSKGHKHDSFLCPFHDQKWHRLVCDLFSEARQTKSPTLAEIFRKDAHHALNEAMRKLALPDEPVVKEVADVDKPLG